MIKFGYSYPAGAENDPLAPYNQDTPRDNAILKDAFAGEYESLYRLHRDVYKYTDCGPTIGALVQFSTTEDDGFGPHETTSAQWIFGDDLRSLGKWSDMDSAGTPVLALMISSIVEGTDRAPDPIVIEINDTDDDAISVRQRFESAVETVNGEACQIWAEETGTQ